MIRTAAILFDFGGTLEADGLQWGVRFHRAYLKAGGQLPLDEFEPLFKESDRRLEELPGIRTLGFRETAEAQADLIRDLLPDGESVDPRRLASSFHQESAVVALRNRPVLQRLASRYPLGVVSNFTGNLDPCLRELNLLDLFGTTLDSAVVGILKPDIRIFRLALERLGVPAEGTWMIGDNFEADIRPAAALGLSTCWIAPSERAEPVPGVATARITRLPELTRLLD